jgi:hypothetical protein
MIKFLIASTAMLLLAVSSMASGPPYSVTEEKTLIDTSGANLVIRGEYLKAWEVAIARFRRIKDIEPAGKDLALYHVLFWEKPDQYVIGFVPKTDSKGRSLEEKGARGTEIRVRKRDLKVESVIFYQ